MKPFSSILRSAIVLFAGLAGLALFLLSQIEGVSPASMKAAGVIVFAVSLWATAVIPESLTSLVFLFLAVTVAGAPPKVVFSGFYSTAAWLVFGGLVIGKAVQVTGLGARIAGVMIGYFRGSYYGVLSRTVLAAALMAFLLPSNMARIMVMLPIFLALAGRLGFAEGRNGRVGIALAVGAGTLYPSLGILTAAVPNLALLGSAESILGLRFTYGQYLLMHFPALAVASLVALPLFLRLLFPDEPRYDGTAVSRVPLSAEEQRLLAVLICCLALWMTDSVHGVSPAWIAMGGAIFCLLPGVGMIPPTSLIDRINLAPWFFLVGVIGMGAVASWSGLGHLIGNRLFAMVPLKPGSDAANLAALNAIGMSVAAMVTMPGQPAIMTTLAESVSRSTGWPLPLAVMAVVPSWTTAIFPYELPPMVVAAQLGGVKTGQLMALLGAMTLLAWLVILPLEYLWWLVLGYFG